MYGFAEENNPFDAVALMIGREHCFIGRQGITPELWEVSTTTNSNL